MVNMTDIFGNALSIAGSFMDSDLVNRFMMVIFAVILVFGVLNCILGYRLLRFWRMLIRTVPVTAIQILRNILMVSALEIVLTGLI